MGSEYLNSINIKNQNQKNIEFNIQHISDKINKIQLVEGAQEVRSESKGKKKVNERSKQRLSQEGGHSEPSNKGKGHPVKDSY